jgi:predicted acyl esterase
MSDTISNRLRKIIFFGLLTASVASSHIARADSETHMVAMRDGTRLATTVYTPDSQGPWPVVLARSPYGRFGLHFDLLVAKSNQQGYVFVIQNVRGKGDSEGNPWIVFRNGGWGMVQDGYDTVEWLAKQAWCNGKIGTWGASALGITQAMMSPSQPPHLKCQHIGFAFSNMYSHCAYQGGVWRTELVEAWLKANRLEKVNLEAFVEHPTYDHFWMDLDAAAQAARVNVPVLFVGGWYDCFSQGTIDGFLAIQNNGIGAARDKCRLVMGPFAHGQIKELEYPPNSRFPVAADEWQWFDHHLKGEENELADKNSVYYYVMGDPEDKDAPGNQWRTADTWPPASKSTRFYLHNDGRLDQKRSITATASKSYHYDPKDPVPTIGGGNLTIPVGPMDQRAVEGRQDVLVFSSPVLTEPLEVTGRICAKLWISSSAPDTDFTAKLSDVYPDGRSMIVTDGILRTRFRESFQEEKMMEPNKVYPIEIDLWSTSLVFNKGHRIRVSISSSNHPRFDPNPNTGAPFRSDNETVIATNTVFLDESHPSCVLLPVVTTQHIEEKEANREKGSQRVASE